MKCSLLSQLVAFLFGVSFPLGARAQWDRVIENFEITSPVKIQGHQLDNTLIRNCKIHGFSGDAVYINDVDNVRIENCEISHVDVGIRLGISGSTHNVTLVNNRIHDVQENGIQAGQRAERGVNHFNLRILNNQIHDTGLSLRGGLTHGMYIQAQDFLIEGNTVMNSHDGNGISVRSSGIIRGNTVGVAQKAAITYYADHKRGPSDRLVIENNIAYGNSTRAAVELLSVPDPANLVHQFLIRFNTVVSFVGSERALQVHSDYNGLDVAAYGNILINTQSASMISSGPFSVYGANYETTSLAGFKSPSTPYDFHLTGTHGAVDFVPSGVSHPAVDIDGEARSGSSPLDAGADEIVQTRRKRSWRRSR